MPSPAKIQTIVEEAVAAVFEAALPALRTQIVNRTVEELQSLEPAPGNLPSDLLNAAAALIQESTSQAEILRHLLEGAARFCGRAALFVVRAGAVTGWQGIGFENNDTLKSVSLNGSAGPVARSIHERATVTGPVTEFDADFVTAVGPPADSSFVVLPLVVKEKVAALIYADGGAVPDNRVDTSALTLLCRFTGLWLELTALRKAGITSPAEESQPQSAVTTAAPVPQTVAAAAAAPAGEEDELHKKARRFAKLLVDEIKLYNQAKVSEGKQNRDLYQRLREDIEKSRATYENRFGSTPAASGNYFTQELIRVLADNDIALMGGNFPQ